MSLTRKQQRTQAAKLKKTGKKSISDEQIKVALASAIDFHRQGYLDKAQNLYKIVSTSRPNDSEIKHLIGVIYYQKGNYEKAIEIIGEAVKMNPDNPAFFNNLANAYTALEKYKEAIYYYEEAIELKEGNYPEAINNIGAAIHQIGQWEKEISYYKQGLHHNPQNYILMNELVKTMRDACDWQGLAEYKKALTDATKQAIANNIICPITPYHSLTLDISPELKKQIAINYASMRYSNIQQKFEHNRKPNNPIRIGYVCADYRDHPTAHLINGLFKYHDRSKFKIYAYSYGKNDGSSFRKSIEQNSDNFVDLFGQSPKQIAKRIYNDKIDILVDVMGYIQNALPVVFAMRPAPIQISYLAYAGTMGASFIDYLVVDRISIPQEQENQYTEKLLLMPDSYFITDNTQNIAVSPTKAECGLPDDKFVFCCFNKSIKIDEVTFSCWMDILKEVKNSVLWLLVENEFARNNLSKEAAKRGVNADRLIFAERKEKSEHLARHACADLFLDCFSVNAHTTAIDSLYAGLPLITNAGDDMMSRASASILNACGLPELITQNEEEFKNLAIKYASDKKFQNIIKKKLAENITKSALFDTPNYVKNLEDKFIGSLIK
jgi:predicted O-linked N-acetylglucosamine transferase (SPINDLY family)